MANNNDPIPYTIKFSDFSSTTEFDLVFIEVWDGGQRQIIHIVLQPQQDLQVVGETRIGGIRHLPQHDGSDLTVNMQLREISGKAGTDFEYRFDNEVLESYDVTDQLIPTQFGRNDWSTLSAPFNSILKAGKFYAVVLELTTDSAADYEIFNIEFVPAGFLGEGVPGDPFYMAGHKDVLHQGFDDHGVNIGISSYSGSYPGGELVASNAGAILPRHFEMNFLDIAQDYGDAPASYGDASHIIVPELYLGENRPDRDEGSQYSHNAYGDGDRQNDASGTWYLSGDEDGAPSQPVTQHGTYIPLFPVLKMTDMNYSVDVKATNSLDSDAVLVGWIDFDGNGAFDADEGASSPVPAGTSGADIALNWTVPVDIKLGTTFIRLRLSTDTNAVDVNQPTGTAANGEVEDYVLAVALDIPPESSAVKVLSNETPLTCQNIIFNDDFDDLAVIGDEFLGPNRGPGGGEVITIRDWTVTGGGKDTYARLHDVSNLGFASGTVDMGTAVYLGNGAVRRISPPVGTGFNFDAEGRLTNIIDAIELRDAPDDDTPGSTQVGWGTSGHWGPEPVRLSRSFTTEIGKVYRLYFKAIPEDIGGIFTTGVLRVDVPGGIAHVKIPASNEGIINYAIEFTADSTNSTISFVNYGHVNPGSEGWCDPASEYNNNPWCTVGGTPDKHGNELIIDEVAVVESDCGSGNINGVVFRDENNNGSYESGSDGVLNNIRVSLYNDQGTADAADDLLVTELSSGSDGRYSFNDVTAGLSYRIEVDSADADLPGGLQLATDNPLTGVSVTSGSSISGQNFGFTQLYDVTTTTPPVYQVCKSTRVEQIDEVQHAIAVGAGISGIPEMSYTAPAGANRVMAVWLSVERDHTPVADGRGDNWESNVPFSSSSSDAPTVKFGGVTMQKKSWNWNSFGSTDAAANAELSHSLYLYLLWDSYIPAGEHDIEITDINTPKSGGDEAILVVTTFANVKSTEWIGGVNDRSAPFEINISASPATTDTQPPGTTTEDNMLLAFGLGSASESLAIGNNWNRIAEVIVHNSQGGFANDSDRTYGNVGVENDGHMLTVQTLQGFNATQTAILRGSSNLLGIGQTAYRLVAMGCDHGDAPASYGEAFTTQSLFSYLGTVADAELATPTVAAARGDDVIGVDDEDGVNVSRLEQGKTMTVHLKVNGGNRYLNAWIDWNADGDFTDSGEQIATAIQDGDRDGVIALSISVPVDAAPGQTYARFRWSKEQTVDPTGFATSGEVEDYALDILEPFTNGYCVSPDGATGWLDLGDIPTTAVNGAGSVTYDDLILPGYGTADVTVAKTGGEHSTSVSAIDTGARQASWSDEGLPDSGPALYLMPNAGGNITVTYDFGQATGNVDLLLLDLDYEDAVTISAKDRDGNPVTDFSGWRFRAGDLSVWQNPDPVDALPPAWDAATATMSSTDSGNDHRSFGLLTPNVLVTQITVSFSAPVGLSGRHVYTTLHTTASGRAGDVGCNGGRITGVVYHDANGNDSYDSGSEAGLASIRLSLFNDQGTAADTSDDTLVTTINSGADGGYAFHAIDKNNTYRVEVDTTDSDLPAGAVSGTPNPVSGIVPKSGSKPSLPVNFGFDNITASASCPAGKVLVPIADKSGWAVPTVSSSYEGGGAELIDGNVSTRWVSSLSGPLPQSAVLDLGQARDVGGLWYYTKVGDPNGKITDYRVEVSNDNTNWRVAAMGALATENVVPRLIHFPEENVRYIRLVIIGTTGGSYVDITELSPLTCATAPEAHPVSVASCKSFDVFHTGHDLENGGILPLKQFDRKWLTATVPTTNDTVAALNGVKAWSYSVMSGDVTGYVPGSAITNWHNSFSNIADWISNSEDGDHRDIGSVDVLYRKDFSLDAADQFLTYLFSNMKLNFYVDNAVWDIVVNGTSLRSLPEYSGQLPGSGVDDPYYYLGYTETNRAYLAIMSSLLVGGNNSIVVHLKSAPEYQGFFAETDFNLACEGIDLSDAPASYGRAAHGLSLPDLYMGSVADADTRFLESAQANGDDSAGSDDEDGLVTQLLKQGSKANLQVNVTQPAAGAGYLQAWIDWNNDGDFADSGEQIANGLQLTGATSGQITVPVAVPSGAHSGNTVARFRWSTTAGLNANEYAKDGEVEDHLVTISAAITTVGEFRFDDCGSGNWNADYSGNDNAATGDVIIVKNDFKSYGCTSVQNSGWNLQVPHHNSYALTDGAVSMLVLDKTGWSSARLLDKGWSDDTKINLTARQVTGGSTITATINGNTIDTGEAYLTQPVDGVYTEAHWMHVMLTFGSQGMKLYINGELKGSNAYSGGITGANGAFRMAEPFGYIDEFYILSGQPNAQQVQAIYNNLRDNKNLDGSSRLCSCETTVPENSCGPVMTSIMPAGALSSAANANHSSVIGFDYHTRGRAANTPDPMQLASAREVGTVWGKAYDQAAQKLYVSAFLRRHAGLHSNGLGAIYAIDVSELNDNGTAGAPSLWLDVNASEHLGEHASLFPYETDVNRGLGDGFAPSHDVWAFNRVGKDGIGGMDLSDDFSLLYAMDMTNRQLLTIDTFAKQVVARHKVTNPGCAGGYGDVRPFGVDYLQGDVYIGVTCSGETRQSDSDVDAFVMRLEGDGFVNVVSGAVGSQEVSFWDARPYGSDSKSCGASDPGFNKWVPVITNMELDQQGNMLIGVTGINGYRFGSANYPADETCNQVTSYQETAGRIMRATPSGNGWMLLASELNHLWSYDHFYADGQYAHWGVGNSNTFLGGMAVGQCTGEEVAIFNLFDPLDYESGGTRYMRTADGQNETAVNSGDIDLATSTASTLEHYQGAGSTWEKSSGMGDLEFLNTDPVAVETGSIFGTVFKDQNGDKQHNTGEPGFARITVYLLNDEDGSLLATTQTTVDGDYGFTAVASNLTYRLVVDENDVDLPDGLLLTTTNPLMGVNVEAGRITRDQDFGFDEVTVGDISGTVYIDSNTNNAFDAGIEMGISAISVTLLNDTNGSPIVTTSTVNNGSYRFSDLDATITYRIAVDVVDADLPAGASIGTINPLTEVRVNASEETDNQNFGFDVAVESYVCPVGMSETSVTGYASSVILDVGVAYEAQALGAPVAVGSQTGSENSALVTKNDQLDLDLGQIVAGGSTLQVSLARNNSSGRVRIETSLDNSIYIALGTYGNSGYWGPGVVDRLDRLNLTVPNGGARYIRFIREAGGTWVDAVSYTQVCDGTVNLTGSIQGIVYSDNNSNDSYDSGTESGIGSVTVNLSDDSSGSSIASISTAVDGSYGFSGLDPALTYRIVVDTNDTDLAGKVIGTSNPLTGVSVIAGVTNADQNFGFDAAGSSCDAGTLHLIYSNGRIDAMEPGGSLVDGGYSGNTVSGDYVAIGGGDGLLMLLHANGKIDALDSSGNSRTNEFTNLSGFSGYQGIAVDTAGQRLLMLYSDGHIHAYDSSGKRDASYPYDGLRISGNYVDIAFDGKRNSLLIFHDNGDIDAIDANGNAVDTPYDMTDAVKQLSEYQGIAFGLCDDSTTPLMVFDYSDAPVDGSEAPMGGVTAYGVASHQMLDSDLKLGVSVTAETNAIQDADNASDDGISAFPVLTEGDSGYTIPAANISGSGTGTLHAWIDFDGDGRFAANEYTRTELNSGMAGDLVWSGQTTMAVGTTWARFRLTSDALVDSVGTADIDERSIDGVFPVDGEIEDYQVNIEADTSFSCSGHMYQVIYGQLTRYDVATSQYVNIGTPTNFNYSMGYRRSDNYLYGIMSGGPETPAGTDSEGNTVVLGDLIRIDVNGDTFKIASTGETVNNHNSADIHQGRGTLWARNSPASIKNTLSEFDLSTGDLLQTITVTGSGFPEINGEILIVGDRVYSWKNGLLHRFTLPVSGGGAVTATSVPISGIPVGSSGNGAAFVLDDPGKPGSAALYWPEDSTGDIYKIVDLESDNPIASRLGTSVVSDRNDGASCPAASSPIEDPDCSLVVVTTTDINSGANNSGSLRDAIQCANEQPGPDIITFDLPTSEPGYNAGSGVWTISPQTPLPTLIDSGTTIDAITQPGAECSDSDFSSSARELKVQLDGTLVSPFGGINGLNVTGSHFQLQGMSITNFDLGSGVYLGSAADQSRLTCNHIGVAADGSTTGSNGTGISVFGTGSSGNAGVTMTGNLISNNSQYGVLLQSGATRNQLIGNRIDNNNWAGIANEGDANNTWTTNSISNNGALGIDLEADGVTANSNVDSWLNYPIVDAAAGATISSNGSRIVSYDFDLDVPSNTYGYRVEFFMNSMVDPSGHGEGETYIGHVDLLHPGNGRVNFKGTFNANQVVPHNANIAITLTEKVSADELGASSEFSGVNNGNVAVCTDLLTDPDAPLETVIIEEGSNSVALLEAKDANGNPITYVISGGVDAARFVIRPTPPDAIFDCLTIEFISGGGIIGTRAVSAGGISGPRTANFEAPNDVGGDNSYNLTITATDSQGNTVTKPFIVNVRDVNEKPTITTPGNINFTERQDGIVQDVNSWDPDVDDTEGSGLVYSLSGGIDMAVFSIDVQTGELRFNHVPDYQQPLDSDGDNIYEVKVRVTDDEGYADSKLLSITVLDDPDNNSVAVQAKVLLQGAWEAATGLMYDALRSQGILPVTQPYDREPFNHSGTETINLNLVNITGNDAMVDWVLLELWGAQQPGQRIASYALLMQRDGDLMDAQTGSTQLQLDKVLSGSYYVSLQHRNHLSVRTAEPVTLGGNTDTLIDFSTPDTMIQGDHTRQLVTLAANTGVNTTSTVTDIALLWSGDITHDQRLVLNGLGNDMNPILTEVLTAPDNTLFNSSYQVPGYLDTDLNMDGITLFMGPGNDANVLLGNILMHPANDGFMSNFVIAGEK